MYLLDTNIVLEILLDQEKSLTCRKFMESNLSLLHISDFSVYSIGINAGRRQAPQAFTKFVNDFLDNITVVSLPLPRYETLERAMLAFGLDFDDAVQYATAKAYRLTLVTMDSDFRRIDDPAVPILFL